MAKNFDLPGRPNFTMTSGRIIAHAVHAALKMEEAYMGDEVLWECDILILALPHAREFSTLMERFIHKQIPFTRYYDQDKLWEGEQLTAICTFPVSQEQAKVLSDLKPWRCACNTSFKEQAEKEANTLGLGKSLPLLSGSSEKERLVFNQEVEGSSPPPRANSSAPVVLGAAIRHLGLESEEYGK